MFILFSSLKIYENLDFTSCQLGPLKGSIERQ